MSATALVASRCTCASSLTSVGRAVARELSEEDLRTVEEQVRGPELLDAEEYPTIRFQANRFEMTSREGTRRPGVPRGRLTLHGETHELDVPVRAEWSCERLLVTGNVRFEQSRFGIEPYRRFLGSISVEDKVEVEFRSTAWHGPE